jgi:hypothetical protein
MTRSHKNNDSHPWEQTSTDQIRVGKRLNYYDAYWEGYQAGRESLLPTYQAMIRLLRKHKIEPAWLDEVEEKTKGVKNG